MDKLVVLLHLRTEYKVFNNRLYWWVYAEYPDGSSALVESGVEDPDGGGGESLPMAA